MRAAFVALDEADFLPFFFDDEEEDLEPEAEEEEEAAGENVAAATAPTTVPATGGVEATRSLLRGVAAVEERGASFFLFAGVAATDAEARADPVDAFLRGRSSDLLSFESSSAAASSVVVSSVLGRKDR